MTNRDNMTEEEKIRDRAGNPLWEAIQRVDAGKSFAERDKTYERAFSLCNMGYMLIDASDGMMCDLEGVLRHYCVGACREQRQTINRVIKSVHDTRYLMRSLFSGTRVSEDCKDYVYDNAEVVCAVMKILIDRVTNEAQCRAMIRNMRKLTNINGLFSEYDTKDIKI